MALTEARKRSIKKYQDEKTDDIKLRPPKGTREKWKLAADKEGKSVTRFVIDAVDEHIAKMK